MCSRFGHAIIIDIGNADEPSFFGKIASDFAAQTGCGSGDENRFLPALIAHGFALALLLTLMFIRAVFLLQVK
ncbi:MAG: hypothetical protein ABJK67_01715 [Anderseniella sp.]